MLSEGKGGFADFGKYRELLTDIFWHGKNPGTGDVVESANAAIGQPTPAEALAEARAMYDRAKAASTHQEGDVN